MAEQHPEDRSPTTLRPASPDDVGALAQLLRRSWLGTMAPHLPSESRTRFLAADPAGAYCASMWPEFIVAELHGAPVGMCHVQGDLLAAIHVDPAWKRRGIGRQLLAQAVREIRRGHAVARLEVLAFNEGARRFYEAFGWHEAKRAAGEEMGSPVELVQLRLDLRAGASPAGRG